MDADPACSTPADAPPLPSTPRECSFAAIDANVGPIETAKEPPLVVASRPRRSIDLEPGIWETMEQVREVTVDTTPELEHDARVLNCETASKMDRASSTRAERAPRRSTGPVDGRFAERDRVLPTIEEAACSRTDTRGHVVPARRSASIDEIDVADHEVEAAITSARAGAYDDARSVYSLPCADHLETERTI